MMTNIVEKLDLRFRSGNKTPVERAVVLRAEWDELIEHIRALEQAAEVLRLENRRFAEDSAILLKRLARARAGK